MKPTNRSHHRHLPAGQGPKLRVMADIVEVKLSEADTNEAYTLFEVFSPPDGGAALLHTHPPQETFYILEGRYEFQGLSAEGVYTLYATAGDVVQIAAGAMHSFHNIGDQAGRVLIVYEPPGKMCAFFETMHAAVDSPDPLTAPPQHLPDQQRILEIFKAHDMQILGHE